MVFPKQDMVLVTTAEESDNSRVFPLIERYLLSELSDEPLTKDAKSVEILLQRMKNWELPILTKPTI